MIPHALTRRFKPRRFRCAECDGFRIRRYRKARIHKRCWIQIEAGLR